MNNLSRLKRISMGKQLKELKRIKICSVSGHAAQRTSGLLNSTIELAFSSNSAQRIVRTSLQDNKRVLACNTGNPIMSKYAKQGQV